MIYKCRMCGGTIATNGKETYGQCDSCGMTQTIPRLDDERRAQLYDRANHFIRQAEYDKAQKLFEQILDEDRTDAEAYWAIVLCKYGVEYVNDPRTGKKVPTCNRVQQSSVLTDADYLAALEHTCGYTKQLYEEQAEDIARIQKRILAVSAKEAPYDVFICYKEKDAADERTPDSVLAQELYGELQKVNLRTFFARITLEDKIGQEYEPYIFAALNSAKVMVVVGTSTAHLNAPWVRNEWSRYLMIMAKETERHLIPAYRSMDAYDLPDEFAQLQAVDLGKIGAMQDLVRGIQKLLGSNSTTGRPSITAEPSADRNLDRGMIHLESREWQKASEYFSRHLDQYPSDYRAWWGSVRALTLDLLEIPCYSEQLVADYNKALRFAPAEEQVKLKAQMNALLDSVVTATKKRIVQDDERIASCRKSKADSSRKIQSLKEKKREIESDRQQLESQNNDLREYLSNAKLPVFPKGLVVVTIIVSAYLVIAFCMSLFSSDYFTEDMSNGGWLPMLIPVVLIGICLLMKRRTTKAKNKIERLKAQYQAAVSDIEQCGKDIIGTDREIASVETSVRNLISIEKDTSSQRDKLANQIQWYNEQRR